MYLRKLICNCDGIVILQNSKEKLNIFGMFSEVKTNIILFSKQNCVRERDKEALYFKFMIDYGKSSVMFMRGSLTVDLMEYIYEAGRYFIVYCLNFT